MHIWEAAVFDFTGYCVRHKKEEREDAGPVPGGIMKKIFEKILVITFDKHSIIANREKNVSAS